MWDRPGSIVIERSHGAWPGIAYDLMPLLFLAAVLVFGIWAVRRISDSNRAVAAAAGGPAAPAVAIDPAVHELRLRYARGELDRDEFAQRWRDLGGEGPEPPPPVPTDAA